eukprot:jgi/Bigna1/44148/e_gw1.89.34.1
MSENSELGNSDLQRDEEFRAWLETEYELGKRIGKGAFSRVYKARHNAEGRLYALKVIRRSRLSEKSRAYLETEIEILRSIDHPNCCQLRDAFHTRSKVYMVLEFCEGGDLLQHICEQKTFTEEDARNIIFKLAEVLKYLHARGIVHRDLKPDNIMYRTKESKEICVVDFGLAKQYSGSGSFNTLLGTPLYLAPEMIAAPGYGKECDMWAVGVILYVVLSGRPPFYSSNQKKLFKIIMSGKFYFEPVNEWEHISDAAKDLIRNLLVVDPKKRFTAAQVLTYSNFKCTLNQVYAGARAPLDSTPPSNA